MARFRNYLLVVVGFTVAGMIGAALGTGTAQAVVSTLVSVVNPSTSPVPTMNVTDPGRIAYQSSVNDAPANGNGCPGATICTWVFPFPPVGHRLVVQHVVGSLRFQTAPTAIDVEIYTTNLASAFLAPIANTLSDFDQPVLFYGNGAAAGDIEVQVVLVGGTFEDTGTSGEITLTGYELDCTVATCAPIAQ